MRKVVITGARNFNSYKDLSAKLKELLKQDDLVITGNAQGVDAIAELFCKHNGIQNIKCLANWEGQGKQAGGIRNTLMLTLFAVDQVYAFPSSISRGTWDCVNKAKERNISVLVTGVDNL